MKHLLRHEWEYLAIGEDDESVSRAEADALLRLADEAAAALRSQKPGGAGEKILLDGRHRLQMQQTVGIMVAGNVTLEILPKTDTDGANCRAGLIAMLAEVGETRIASLGAASLETQNHNLLEIMIAGFARDLLAALRPGLSRSYLPDEGDLPALRGRLDPRRQVSRLAGRADVLACRFDALSADTALNRILKSAALLLLAVSRRSSNRRLLTEALFFLDPVTELERGPIPSVRFTRMIQRFRPLHDLACLFLRHSYQSTSSGRRDGIAMLFRMNELFEAWIGGLLQRSLQPAGWMVHLQAKGQVRHALKRRDQGLLPCIPISFWSGAAGVSFSTPSGNASCRSGSRPTARSHNPMFISCLPTGRPGMPS